MIVRCATALTLEALREGPQDPCLDQFSLLFGARQEESPVAIDGLVRLYHPAIGQAMLNVEPYSQGARKFIAHFTLLA